jgi:hypothetical protein
MKPVKTVPFALFILCTGVGCSSSSTPPGGSGGATVSGGSSSGGASTGGASAGGSPSTGGASTGGASTGGASTGGTGTGGGDDLSPSTILPGLDGTFWAFRTMNGEDPGDSKYWLTAPGAACPTGDWATAGVTLSKEYHAAGTPGQQYTVHFQLRGALALRCYEGGTPTAMAPDAAGVNESFYAGGQQSGDGFLNAVGLTVSPAAPDAAAGTYFLNGIPSTSGACDQQITYDVGYEAEFVIMGDSTVTLGNHAPECQALQNCGADPGTCAPRSINMDGVEVHASPDQPISDFLNDATFYPQWLVFDITSITSP